MKMMKAVLVMALVLALATPALAELKLNGYYRVQGTAQNSTGPYDKWGVADEASTDTFVDNRLRMMLTNQFNDKVKFVYFGEVDTPWGLASKGGIGGGGRESADGVNVETKQVYLNFLTAGWDFTVGVQNMADNVAALVINNDVAGVTAKTKMGMFGLTLRYSKLYENDASPHVADSWNDEDFYGVQTSFTLSDTARIGFDVLYFDDNADFTAASAAAPGTVDVIPTSPTFGQILTLPVAAVSASGGEREQLYVSADGDFNFGPANLTGFVMYGEQDGDSPIAPDGDNWMASAQVLTKLGNGNISLRGIYFQDADGEAGDILFTDDHGTAFQFYNEGLMIFLTDIYYNNGAQGGLYKHAIDGGHGMSALTLKGNVGFASDYYLRYAAGYFMANEEVSVTGVDRDDKYMGTEVDLMVGKKFNEKIDLSLRGAYAFLGDFFDTTAAGSSTDPDDPWKVVGMINVSY